jgi:hypothetical protein
LIETALEVQKRIPPELFNHSDYAKRQDVTYDERLMYLLGRWFASVNIESGKRFLKNLPKSMMTPTFWKHYEELTAVNGRLRRCNYIACPRMLMLDIPEAGCKLFLCGVCRSVRYCTRDCQKVRISSSVFFSPVLPFH